MESNSPLSQDQSSPANSRSRFWLWVGAASAIALAAILFDVPPQVRGPAPFPPDWQFDSAFKPIDGRWILPLLLAVGIIGLIGATGWPLCRRRPRAASWAILGLGVALGFALQMSLLSAEEPGAIRLLTKMTISDRFTGYHTVASYPLADGMWDYIIHQDEIIRRLPPSRPATKPPGPVVFFFAMIEACRTLPPLQDGALGMIRGAGLTPASFHYDVSPEGMASALVGAMLLILLGALAAAPLAGLGWWLTGDALAGARLGLLWLLIPGTAISWPQFDYFLALPVTLAVLTLGLGATTKRREAAWVWSAIAGGAVATAMFFTYGAALFLAIGGAAALMAARAAGASWRKIFTAAVIAAVVGLAVFFMPALWGHRPIEVFKHATHIHRDYFTQPRRYWLWIVFNLVDFGIQIGAPIVAIGAWGMWSLCRATARRQSLGELRSNPSTAFFLAVTIGIVLLDISGQTRAETGRLWMPLMPCAMAAFLAGPAGRGHGGQSLGRWGAIAIGLGLAAFLLAIKLRWMPVGGYP